MRILYVYRSLKAGPSIRRVFEPIEKRLKDSCVYIDSIYLPCETATLKAITENVRLFKKTLKSNRYDIVHITGDVYYLLYFAKDVKTVVTVHDLASYTNTSSKWVKRELFKLLWIKPLQKADCVTFISDKSKQEAKGIVKLKEGKLRVIPNSYNSEYYYMPKESNMDCPIILHVGTKANKNLLRVIEALKDFKCKLHIIGEPSAVEVELLTRNHIDYRNESNVSDKEILQAYVDCDIVSFPSLYEGFGMPIIEAQAIGRCVVTSNISPMSDIAQKSTVLVDPFDVNSIRNGFIEACKNSKLYVELGLKNAGEYSLQKVSEMYLTLYCSLMGKDLQ